MTEYLRQVSNLDVDGRISGGSQAQWDSTKQAYVVVPHGTTSREFFHSREAAEAYQDRLYQAAVEATKVGGMGNAALIGADSNQYNAPSALSAWVRGEPPMSDAQGQYSGTPAGVADVMHENQGLGRGGSGEPKKQDPASWLPVALVGGAVLIMFVLMSK